MAMDVTPIDEFVGPPAPAAIYAAAPAAEVSALDALNAALAASGKKMNVSVLASDVTPYHGGKNLVAGKVNGEAGGVLYDVKAGTALAKDTVLDQRYGELSGSARIRVGPGAVGVEVSRQVGMALGQMPVAKVLDMGDVNNNPSLVDVPQPLQSLSVTKYGVVLQSGADQSGLPYGVELRAGKVAYTLGGVKHDYGTVSATMLGSLSSESIWDVKLEHGTAGTDGSGFNVASGKIEALHALPKDFRLRFVGAAQVASDNTPAPGMFTLGSLDRAPSYAAGAKMAPSGVAAGVTLVTPSLVKDKNVRGFAGVSGGVGTMQDRTNVVASSAEVGVVGSFNTGASLDYVPVNWKVGYARALEHDATDKGRLMFSLVSDF